MRTLRLTIGTFATGALLAPALLAPVADARAQSLLDRPDNLSTDWVGGSGTLYFNFVHRFSVSPAPERKVTNFPTFLIAAGYRSRVLVGLDYATNSALAARYPNEYEFFGRYAPVQQEEGASFDLGAQLDYNLAVKGLDGEVSIARRQGPVRFAAVTRMIADTLGGSRQRLAFGGGGTVRLNRFVALAGDASALVHRENGEKAAWSAGLHIALPTTPHTLSLHVSNASTSTLQGLTRGSDTKRYGFEFTIPIHLSRFFGAQAEAAPTAPGVRPAAGRAAPPAPADAAAAAPRTPPAPAATAPAPTSPVSPRPVPADSAAPKPSADRAATPDVAPARQGRPATSAAAPSAPKVVRARIKGQAFVPSTIQIDAGTTVQWKNLDALIHTVTSVDGSFDSGVIGADGSYSHTFAKPGRYPIFCSAHPFMKAAIVVK
jgi:plastocyanin